MEKLSKILAVILAAVMVLNIGVFATDTPDATEDTTTTTQEETTTQTEEPSTEATEESTTEATTEATTEETTTQVTTEESTTDVTEETTTEVTSEETTQAVTDESTTQEPTEDTTASEETTTEIAEESTTTPEEETTTEVSEESTTVPEEESTTVPEEVTTTTPDTTDPTDPSVPDVTDPTDPTEPEVTDPTEPTEPEVTEPTEPEKPAVELPAAPSNLNSGAFSKGNISVTWDAVDGAAGYDVYLKSGDEWVFQSSVIKTKCTLKNALYNSKYVMGIKTYITVDGEKYESAEISEYTILTGTEIPTTKFTVSASGDTVTLKWDAIKGVSGYRVYIKKDGKWVKLTSTSDNTYTYKKALPGKTYKFAIKPYAKGNQGTEFGKLQTGKVTIENYSKTTVKASDKTASTITLKWTKVKNASGYRVYIHKNGKWVYYKGITKNTYTIKGLKDATNYKIKVKPYFKADGKTIWGSYSDTITVATAGKEVKAYRIENLKKQFTKDNWSVRLSDGEGLAEVVETIAFKNGTVYNKCVATIFDKSETISIGTKNNIETHLYYPNDKVYFDITAYNTMDIYEYTKLFNPLLAKNIKAKTTIFNGKRVVAEYFKGPNGNRITYYFDGDKVVGFKAVVYQGYEIVYTSYKVLGKPADSLFKFPTGYTKGE